MGILEEPCRDELFKTYDSMRDNWFAKKRPNLSWYIEQVTIWMGGNKNDKHDSRLRQEPSDREQ